MESLKKYLKEKNVNVEEIMDYVTELQKLLDYCDIPVKYLARVLISYVVLCTGSDEEIAAQYLVNHGQSP